MPYTINNLPSYISNKSDSVKKKWMEIFNSVYKDEGEEKAFIIANTWLKKHLVKSEIQAKTVNAKKVEFIKFESSTTEFLSKSENGEDYIEFTLTDIYKDSQGDSYPKELLQQWADYINSGNAIIGDIDHEEYDKLLSQNLSEEQIKSMLKAKPGIAKSVKAMFNNGVLKVRAAIDKRYKKLVSAARGVSLEALVTRDSKNNIISGDLLGFTFGMNDTPANPRAKIAV